MIKKQVITIVGGGSSAHVLVPLLSKAGHTINILTGRPIDWSRNVEVQFQSCEGGIKKIFKGTLNSISDRPIDVIPQSDIVILCMPVSKYREALHRIASYITDKEGIFIGAIYGQAGFNWMVDEIKQKYGLKNVTYFAIGLLPWICRTIEYGRVGVTYGPKKVNVVAVSNLQYFPYLNNILLQDICERWFDTGAFVPSDNFLSLTLSVDNQIIHPSRSYGLFLRYGGRWKTKNDIPYFYRDFDQLSADILCKLDADYSLLRHAIKTKYPRNNFRYMLDYLALERLSYQSENNDICTSFTSSNTLGAIKTPTIRSDNGEWVIDKNHRFFTDDIHYGLCIAKWIAQQLDLHVSTIDSMIEWAQNLRDEKIIDGSRLLPVKKLMGDTFLTGVPSEYGFRTIDDIID